MNVYYVHLDTRPGCAGLGERTANRADVTCPICREAIDAADPVYHPAIKGWVFPSRPELGVHASPDAARLFILNGRQIIDPFIPGPSFIPIDSGWEWRLARQLIATGKWLEAGGVLV